MTTVTIKRYETVCLITTVPLERAEELGIDLTSPTQAELDILHNELGWDDAEIIAQPIYVLEK